MANNCLVTKLKEVVDNDNLPVLNGLRVKFYQAETYNNVSHSFRFRTSDNVTITATGGHTFSIDGGAFVSSWTGKGVNPSTDIVLKGENANYSIVIKGTDKIVQIANTSSDTDTEHYYGFDVSELLGNTTLMVHDNTHIVGQLKYIGEITNIDMTKVAAMVNFDSVIVKEDVSNYFLLNIKVQNTSSTGNFNNASLLYRIAKSSASNIIVATFGSSVSGNLIEILDIIKQTKKSGVINFYLHNLWTVPTAGKFEYTATFDENGYTLNVIQ